MRDGNDHLSFIRACLSFSEITIPSIPAPSKQLNLYLETAEVALLGGLISYTDGLIDSAICCLQNICMTDGLQMPDDIDGVISLMRKLISFILLVPGNPEQGITYVPNSMLSLVCSASWMLPRMRIRVLCSFVSFSATLLQNQLPYHAMSEEVIGNDRLLFDHSTSSKEVTLLCDAVLENIVNTIPQEPLQAARANLALEACNCIASAFIVNQKISEICLKLVETARSGLGDGDKYLLSTVNFLRTHSSTFEGFGSS